MTAAQVGVMREVQNRRAGRVHAHGCGPDNGWSQHIEGAAGELAVAKALGLFWSGAVGNLAADDVGPLQVRTTRVEAGCLIVHPSDPADRAFVLVTGQAPDFMLRGWIMGRHAKRHKWWADPAGGRPAFFVPQRALQDV